MMLYFQVLNNIFIPIQIFQCDTDCIYLRTSNSCQSHKHGEGRGKKKRKREKVNNSKIFKKKIKNKNQGDKQEFIFSQ